MIWASFFMTMIPANFIYWLIIYLELIEVDIRSPSSHSFYGAVEWHKRLWLTREIPYHIKRSGGATHLTGKRLPWRSNNTQKAILGVYVTGKKLSWGFYIAGKKLSWSFLTSLPCVLRTIKYLHRCSPPPQQQQHHLQNTTSTIQYLHRCLKTKDPLCQEQYNIYTDAHHNHHNNNTSKTPPSHIRGGVKTGVVSVILLY